MKNLELKRTFLIALHATDLDAKNRFGWLKPTWKVSRKLKVSVFGFLSLSLGSLKW